MRADIVPGGSFPDYQQHLQLAAHYPEIAVAYTQIITISTDNILKTNEFRASAGAQWTFLSDAGRKVQKDLEIQEYTDAYYDPMIPHALKPGLVIYSIYNGYWLVLGQAADRGPPPRSSRGDPRNPPGLGPGRPRPPLGLGSRRPLEALP